MESQRTLLRIALIVIWMHYTFLINVAESQLENESRSMLSLTDGEKNMKREAGMQSHSEESEGESEDHGRQRRSPCCPVASCSDSRYRFIDGTCNNLNNPCWGSARTPYIRILKSMYQDGISSPRGTGKIPSLPRPRDVSVGLANISSPISRDAKSLSLMVMQWGQFVDHDMVLTPTPEDYVKSCCNGSIDPYCFPIDVTGDPFYSSFGITCLPFFRSLAAACTTDSAREQINERTSYLDGTQVYGSSLAELNAVRINGSYLMKFGPRKENPTCPAANSHYSCRSFLPERPKAMTDRIEFFAGDRRAEDQPGLTSLHTIFLRMHNDLASKIKSQNLFCPNETVFQETRKLVGALIQHITYDEFLPIILGKDLMEAFSLDFSYYKGYDPSIDASIPSSFATAAFRFGHSLISDFFKLPKRSVSLAENYFIHESTTDYQTFPSQFIIGIASDYSEPMDHILVDAVRNKLLATFPFKHGQDLLARNIQRGRDHGLPGYKEWINYCIPGAVQSFDDLSKYMPTAVAEKLKELYSDIDDIDLYPAGIAELSTGYSLLGPTFSCLIARQFYNLKYGDRFWLENNHFTRDQFDSIRNTKLSILLCLYTGALELQRNVLLPVSERNPLQSCSTLVTTGILHDINLYWSECKERDSSIYN